MRAAGYWKRVLGMRRAPQALLCLLLLGLLLFNPFATASSESTDLAYRTLPRHRATIGASEMEHFSPIQKELASPDLVQTVEVNDVKLTPAVSVGRVILREELPLRPALVAVVWFRPPPS